MRVTHLNAILALLLWSGIDPAISLKYTYVTNSLSIPLLIDITPISSFAVMNNGAITLLVHAFWYVCAAVSLRYTQISGVAESQGRLHAALLGIGVQFLKLCQFTLQPVLYDRGFCSVLASTWYRQSL